MLKSLHFIYNGFSEYEVALACSMLASKGELYTASLDREEVRGEAGFTLRADLNFNDVNAADFDILVISGMLDAKPYWEAMSLFAKIAKFNSDGKVIAAICGGPLFLGKASVLRGRRYTCGIPLEGRNEVGVFSGAEFVDQDVVTDQNLITAKGFATVGFALGIADKLSLFSQDERKKFESFWSGK
jgi:protein deglycase